MASPTMTAEYRLRLGRVVLALQGLPGDLADLFATWFARPSDPAPPDVALEVVLRDHEPAPAVPNSLILTKRLAAGRLDIADGLVTGAYDAATGRGRLEVHATLTRGRRLRVFEQLLYQAFYSARRRAGYDAALVHSCAVIHDGAGYLFAGPPESGKTTIARLSADRHVLNDEMPIVEFRDGAPWVVGTPFNGLFAGKSPGEAPVRGVLLLAHGSEHVLARPRPAEAAAALAAEVAPPLGLEEAPGGATTAAMLEFATRIDRVVPVRRLVFRPDAGFWPVIESGLPAAGEVTT